MRLPISAISLVYFPSVDSCTSTREHLRRSDPQEDPPSAQPFNSELKQEEREKWIRSHIRDEWRRVG